MSLYSLTSTRSIRSATLVGLFPGGASALQNEYATRSVAVAAALAEPSAAIEARRRPRIEPRSNWELTIRIPSLQTLTFVVSTASALITHLPSRA